MHLLQFLLFHAVPVTKDGLTPLGLAVSEGRLYVIKCLVKECHVEVNGEGMHNKSISVAYEYMHTDSIFNCCKYSTFLRT